MLVTVDECISNVVVDTMGGNVDELMEVPIADVGCAVDMSKLDVIMLELWSENDADDVRDELSIELEILLIVVAATSDEDVAVSIEVAYERDVDDNDKDSLDCGVFSIVLNIFSLLLVEINSVVVRSDSTDEVWSLWVLKGVVNIDVSEDIKSACAVVLDAADNVLVCSIEENVEGNDTTDMVVTTVEVDASNSSVVVEIKVFIVVPSVDITIGEDEDEYSVELIRSSFAVDIELNMDSVDAEDDDSVELTTVSGVIDWLLPTVISLLVVSCEDEIVFVVDVSVRKVEVKSLAVSVEECINNVVSDAVVEIIDGYIEVLTVVIGWTDDVSKIDAVISVVCSVIDDDDDAKDDVSSELVAILIPVVAASVSNEDVSVSVEVAYECDVDDDSDSTEEVDATNSSVVVPSVDMNNGEDDDWVELTAVTGVIDSVVDSVISLFVVAFEDEMIFDVDFSVVTVEVSPLLVSVEECVNNVVSDAVVEIIDGYIEVLTVVIGWTDDVSKIDAVISVVCSVIDDDDDAKDDVSSELVGNIDGCCHSFSK